MIVLHANKEACYIIQCVYVCVIHAVDGLLGKLNEALADDHPDDTMKILQNPDANFPFVTTEPMKYHRALLRETREGVPGNVLVSLRNFFVVFFWPSLAF